MPQEITDYGSYNMPSQGGAFLKLEQGDNRVRLCSNPQEVVSHDVSKEGEKFATSYCPGESCELCKQGKAKKYKYGYLVLNRKDNKVYVYEAPITVFKQIVGYATNPEYGDPTKYDITIKKEGEKLQMTYTVIASPKPAPLTKEEQEILANSEVTIESAYADRK